SPKPRRPPTRWRPPRPRSRRPRRPPSPRRSPKPHLSRQPRNRPRDLLFVGLTGGLGSGKSEALAACERLGAATLSSDAVVHELLGTDEVRELLRERWGEQVVAGGEVDRAAVAS